MRAMYNWYCMTFAMVLIAWCSVAGQQRPYTPKVGSKERKEILNALRPTAEDCFSQKIEFVIERFRVNDTWAYVSADPRQKGGKPLDYDVAGLTEAIDEGFYDAGSFYALLRYEKGRWVVVEYAHGCTDVCYDAWIEEYNLPKGLIE